MAHDAEANVAIRTEMVTYGPGVESQLTHRSSGRAPEGILLRPRFGEDYIHALWRRKGGVEMFTGIVRLPVTSESWEPRYDDCCFAKLVDRDGPLNGLCVVITPEEFLDAMAEYDH